MGVGDVLHAVIAETAALGGLVVATAAWRNSQRRSASRSGAYASRAGAYAPQSGTYAPIRHLRVAIRHLRAATNSGSRRRRRLSPADVR